MKAQGVSSHFIVSLRGTVAQLVGVNDSAFGNGLSWDDSKGWICPHHHQVRPSWQLVHPPTNPNLQTISIEHEGKSGDPWPLVQSTATVELLQWLGRQFPSLLPYRVNYSLTGHASIDPVDKSFCPGSGIDLDTLAARANAGPGPIAPPPPEPWIAIWQQRGVPLPIEQAGWAIPQLYKFHASELGGLLKPEQYLAPGVSVAIFERGLIYYLAKTNQAYMSKFPVDI
jgi:hypothetical protein